MNADWGASARITADDFYDCPECRAPAIVIARVTIPCRTWEVLATEVGGVTEAVEMLDILTVECAAGHRFHGPEEMLHPSPEQEVKRWAA